MKVILKDLKIPENMGVIVRTAGLGRTKTEIQKAVELSARNAMESRKASELIIETVSHIGEGVEELAVMADELQQG